MKNQTNILQTSQFAKNGGATSKLEKRYDRKYKINSIKSIEFNTLKNDLNAFFNANFINLKDFINS